MDINIEKLKKLIKFFNKSNLSEIEIKRGQWKVLLKRARRKLKQKIFRSKQQGVRLITVTSTEVGIFHRKRDSEDSPWIEEGDTIKKGDRLGFIKVLGIESEIKAEQDGIVIEFYAEEGEEVDYGKELLLMQSTSTDEE